MRFVIFSLILLTFLGGIVVGQSNAFCKDPDGRDLFTKTTVNYKDSQGEFFVADFCYDEIYLSEGLCNGKDYSRERILCDIGCFDGRCITSAGKIPKIITQEGTYTIKGLQRIEINGISLNVIEISWALQGNTEPKVVVQSDTAVICNIVAGGSCIFRGGSLSHPNFKGIEFKVNYIDKNEESPQDTTASITIKSLFGENEVKIDEHTTTFDFNTYGNKYVEVIINFPGVGKISLPILYGKNNKFIGVGKSETANLRVGTYVENGDTLVFKSHIDNYFIMNYVANFNGLNVAEAYILRLTNFKYNSDNVSVADVEKMVGKDNWMTIESGISGGRRVNLGNASFIVENIVREEEKVLIKASDQITHFDGVFDVDACSLYLPAPKEFPMESYEFRVFCPKFINSISQNYMAHWVDGTLRLDNLLSSEYKGCNSIGLRKENQYCSGDEQWETQKTNSVVCNNNFECSSNLCIDDICVEKGLFTKFLEWLESIFG
jgi:hypothetical protein